MSLYCYYSRAVRMFPSHMTSRPLEVAVRWKKEGINFAIAMSRDSATSQPRSNMRAEAARTGTRSHMTAVIDRHCL